MRYGKTNVCILTCLQRPLEEGSNPSEGPSLLPLNRELISTENDVSSTYFSKNLTLMTLPFFFLLLRVQKLVIVNFGI